MKIIFKGIVQGVGFRPTIYRIAKQLKLSGYVLNKGSEVEVVIDNKKDMFLKEVENQLPSIAKITSINEEKDNRKFDDFRILHSKEGGKESLIPVDVGICNNCLKELFNEKNKRFLFPFTNCTVCGARFSLIKDVPYDRERTSMDEFKLCESCEKEYESPLNRRYHAQTISCPTCGPLYRLYDKNKKDLGEKQAIKRFANQIDGGKIGVIKSWGGMHLCCNLEQINRFRKWYNRPQKAFALMVKDITTAEKYAKISDYEKEILNSKVKPIVLLKKIEPENASPGLNTIGLFLPYTGLHHLLFSHLKSDAIVMTSSNVPGEAMITKDEEAFEIDADIYLLHNRAIPNRIDDSVVKIWKDRLFFIRKSRGYVPEPIEVNYNSRILSVGADENITGAVSNNKNVFPTQYIGHSKYYSTLEFLDESLSHMMKLTMNKPSIDATVCDLHPGYDSRNIAEKYSERFSVPMFEVQHDWAHAASLILDNKLDESVVIVVEGLGYGIDGNFWGGEVLHADFNDFKRIGHSEYIPLIGGDKATLDPRRLVYAIFNKFEKKKFFSVNDAEIFSKMIPKSPLSGSIGRYLDAISAYLNICTEMTYGGEPAMKLEKYLENGVDKYNLKCEIKDNILQVTDLFNQIDELVKPPFTEKDKSDISYSMVKSIVKGLSEIAINYAQKNNLKNIGLSGGVSYNIPIIEMFEEEINKEKLNLVLHKKIPNGDCGISIGQNVIVGNKLK